MSYGELDFTQMNLTESWREVNQMLAWDFSDGCRRLLAKTLNLAIDEEYRSLIGARRYERVATRQDWRNGYRSRQLLTRVGLIELKIPRLRRENFQPSWLERYQRLETKVTTGLKTMFIAGASTEKVGDILQVLCGARVSRSTVSKLAQSLNDEVQAYTQRPLDDQFVFLFLDGLSVKIRRELKAERWELLVAYGIRANGSREMIGFAKYRSEASRCWESFLDNLKMRGLKGSQLKLIIMDGSTGLWKAVAAAYPQVEGQLCWVHKLRNVANACPERQRAALMAEITPIMYASSATVAAKRFRAWRTKWQADAPKAVACLERNFDQLLPMFAFPEGVRKIIRTTNVIERAFREVRRRVKPMGYFPNFHSCQRIVYALFARMNARWERPDKRVKPIQEAGKPAA